MKDMQELYNDFNKLREEVNGLNLNEVGYFRLSEYRRRFEQLHEKNLELQTSLRTSDVDNEELRQALNLGDTMWVEVGDTLTPIVDLVNFKMTLGYQTVSEKRTLQTNLDNNLRIIESLTASNKGLRERLDNKLISSDDLRNVFEEQIRSNDQMIQEIKNINVEYERRIEELREKLRIIAFGGKLPELENFRNSAPSEPIPPLPGVDDEPSEEPEEPIPPFPGGDDEPSEEPEEPVPPFPGGDDEPSEEPEEPIPPFPGGDDEPSEEPEEPIPPFPGDDDEPSDDEPEEDDEEEEEPPVRATVKAPKASLWSKIKKVLEGAKVFLLTAIAVHTGLALVADTEKVEPSSPEEVVEETIDETIDKEEEPTEDNKADKVGPEEINPHSEEPTEDKEEDKDEEEVPQLEEKDTDHVVLEKGESVYDSETGVEVGYNGNAGQETSNGYVNQNHRDLEPGSNGTVIVNNDDLQPDSVSTPEGRTGQEISEEDARSNMTDQENQNLDDAIDEIDWEQFFNSGPTL